MRDSGLAPDIPLGPFEGASITIYTAGKAARLHARRDCPRLGGEHVSELKMPLSAAGIKRMCAECARWGEWAPPGTALGMYLANFSGWGLARQLDSYTGPDSDDAVTREEIADAAALLRCGEYPPNEGIGDSGEENDEDRWDAFRAARELRDSRIVPEWCSAVESLMDAAGKVARYPWLKPWAGKRLALKSAYAETLRRQAAQFLSAEALEAACAAHRMPAPELPADDPAFAVLGGSADIRGALQRTWREWQHDVSHGWLAPHRHEFPAHELAERMGNKRKAREELRERARKLLDSWAGAAVAAAAGDEFETDQLVVASIRLPDKQHDGRRPPFGKQLTKWELGVLIMFTVAAGWSTRTFLLKVPKAIADRLLAHNSAMSCSACAGDPADVMAYEGLLESSESARLAEAGHGAFLPGMVDDTPVSQRRVVTASEVRALREALDDHRQLFVVCSVAGGVEVLPLAEVEERCGDGWSGVLVAEAGDLPLALFEPHLGATANGISHDSDYGAVRDWDDRDLPAEDPGFGGHLGNAAGERKLRWMCSRRNDARRLERDYRIFALAQGVHDLRMLAWDSDSGVPSVPSDVWLALLLVRERLSLRPFWPRVSGDSWNSGLGLPLGVLAGVQIYTTNADPRITGKGHSPFCQHVRDRGVRRDDFLLTLEEVMRRTDLDWCGNCDGYAIRRLTDEQISYYRAAHRLLDIDQAIARELDEQSSRQCDLAGASTALGEISQWLHGRHERWQAGDTWRVQDVVRELKDRAERLGRYRRDGWPDSGSVAQLKPRR